MTEKTYHTLTDLVGEHMLSGVDREAPDSGQSAIRFVLDGVLYVAEEDQEDGYRSFLGDLYTVPGAICVNPFPPTRVEARITGTVGEILEFTDCTTGRTVLRVGTAHSDTYYPYFVDEFDPRGLACNAENESRS